MDSASLLHAIAPTAVKLVDRHFATSREWFPHELVPYSRARYFEPGEVWSEESADLGGVRLSPAVRSALFVNLLTEDNLPYYSRDVHALLGGADEVYLAWARRWTAEEGRHSVVIRDYLTVTRAIDPIELERGRMAQVSRGEVPAPPDSAHGLVYLALQELATRISHRATGRMIGDPAGERVMARVATDENLHQLFYRDLAAAAVEADPSTMVQAIEHQVRTFAMPGTGIPSFDAHAALIARAGIYDLAVHHEQILVPVVLRQWRVEDLTGLTPEAERARDQLIDRIDRIGKAGRRMAERRMASAGSTSG